MGSERRSVEKERGRIQRGHIQIISLILCPSTPFFQGITVKLWEGIKFFLMKGWQLLSCKEQLTCFSLIAFSYSACTISNSSCLAPSSSWAFCRSSIAVVRRFSWIAKLAYEAYKYKSVFVQSTSQNICYNVVWRVLLYYISKSNCSVDFIIH